MKEAILLQFLIEFLTQDKFGDIVKDYKLKRSSDEIKLNVIFDLTKLKEPTPILGDKAADISDSKVVEELKELVGVIQEPETPIKEEPEVKLETVLKPKEPKAVEEKPKDESPDFDIKPIKEQLEDRLERLSKPIVPLSKMPSISADENSNVIIGEKATKPTSKETKNVNQPILSNGKSLYKDHYFSDDEVTYLNAYINKELTGAEGAELLGLKTPSEFYNLVQRYKRSKNISGKPKKMPSRTVPSLRAGQKMTTDDLKLTYEKVSKGETNLASIKLFFMIIFLFKLLSLSFFGFISVFFSIASLSFSYK